jgi:cytochrome c oxidase subunit III
MPGSAVTEDVTLINAGRGGGGASSGGNGQGGHGGGDGDASSGRSSGGVPGEVPQRTYVTGMTVALGGVLMFFMALVSAFIVRKASADWAALAMPRVLWLNTAILVASSFALAHSRKRLRANDDAGFRHWWAITTILGLFFLAGQIIAWRQLVAQGLFLATNPSSSFFYVFTVAHALHLLGGVIALISIALRSPSRPFQRLTRATATEVAAMYWHFMDGLWVFLFLVLLLGR